MPAFQAKKLVKGVSDETEVSDLQGTLAGRSRWSHGDRPRYPEMCGQRGPSHENGAGKLDRLSIEYTQPGSRDAPGLGAKAR